MTYFTTNLTTAVSSAPGASTACNLNWLGGKPTTVSVLSTAAAPAATFKIQYTLDDLQRVASSLVFWSNLSSSYNDTGVTTSSGSTFNSSLMSAEGIVFSFLSPMSAVRLNATGMDSGPLTMKVLQGEGW